ncbi:tRNA lysidine(34) synthetase TilS [Buchnera aphidicola (Takecallis taiwana)]|uniref:tRNA lysidine(34) synthetase TilS n=1 Tax=Buchnera aphidicola TaxID=9 RepID=UPI0031B7243F
MIKDFIKNIKNNQKILISYSGGLDSTVLLYQLIPFIKQIPFLKLRAIHINHQLNKQSFSWAQYCRKICKKYSIPIIIKTLHIQTKNNIQETARKLRYKIIAEHMLPDEILVTGHHSNDQCETLFLSLKRGSGISGLSGILQKSFFNKNKKIIRPLLNISKEQLETWAIKKNINWVEDDSNYINKYDRNFIRNKIIIPIQKRWPYFIQNCIRSMRLCYDQNIAINYFLDQIIHDISLFTDTLNISKFYIYPKAIQILLLRRWMFFNQKHHISYNETKNIYNNIITTKNQNTINRINIKNISIQKYKNNIFYIPKHQNIKNRILFWFDYYKPLKLPNHLGYIIQDQYGMLLPKPNTSDLINIRFQLYENIRTDIGETTRKNFWQKNKIAPWNRNRIPILFYNTKLIAIMGFLVIKNQHTYTNTWRLSWIDFII